MTAFIHGILLAVGLILPLGVQNLFVFQQGMLQKTYLHALPVVITAAVCDTILIVLAVNGISLLMMKVAFLQITLISGGVVFLIYMGWKTWHSSDEQQSQGNGEICSAKQQILTAAAVSIINPYAVLDIVGVIGTSSVIYQGIDKVIFMCACILVSWLWFTNLAAVGHLIGRRSENSMTLKGINRFSALFMWTTAAYLVYTLC